MRNLITALVLIAAANSANATIIEKTFDFTASNFTERHPEFHISPPVPFVTGSLTVQLDTDVTNFLTYQPPFTFNTNAPQSPTRAYDGFLDKAGTNFFICSCGEQPELTAFTFNIANIYTDTPSMFSFSYLDQPFIFTGQSNPWIFDARTMTLTPVSVPGPIVGQGPIATTLILVLMFMFWKSAGHTLALRNFAR
jgi:hypothetical protein